MTWQPPDGDRRVPDGWSETVDDRSWARKNWPMFIAAPVVAVIFVAMAAGSGSNDPDRVGGGRWQAHAQCAEFTRDRLRAPATADFPEFDDRGVSISSSGDTWTVSSFVDSENGFGANVRTSFRCVVVDQGDTWRLEDWGER